MKRQLNFRDLGGIPSADGQRTVPRGLYMRSGKLSILTPQQCQRLCHERGIGCIIDLRTPGEAAEYPDPVPPGVRYVQIPLLSDATIGITHETGSDPMTILRRLRHDPQRLQAMMPDIPALYRRIVTDPYSVGQVEQVMQLLHDNARQGIGTLFHCTAGKDRTGIIAMHLLRQYGVDERDIIRDYMRTNRAALLPTLRKCLGVLLLTHNLPLTRLAYHAFMAEEHLIRTALDAAPPLANSNIYNTV